MNVYELLSLKIIPQEISASIYDQREANTFHTPYKDEIRLFSCIKQGNLELLIEQLKGFLGSGIVVGNMSKNNSRQHKYMAVSCITLATRYAIQGGINEADAYNFSDDFIRTMDTIENPMQIMEYLAEKIIELTNLVASNSKKLKYSPHIRKCIAYINKNLHRKISVKDLAEDCGLSEDYISHLFKKEVGENLSSFILKQKLELSKTLLFEEFDGSKISYMLGFCSQSHFISAFKKEYGITPREFVALNK
ncbi:MAG: AraC family transcriptional regulator [Eubacterium sp.]|nr:AraC family transcriptional regulator [Eubacterium sp.]